jgi:signal transduction histidine kinase
MLSSSIIKKQQLLFILPLGICMVCFIVSGFATSVFFKPDDFTMHHLLEIICTAIAFMIFCLIWFTYKQNSVEMHILSFGFLLVFLFQIMHIMTFSTSNDYNLWYYMLARLIEISTLNLCFIPNIRTLKITKVRGTIIALIAGIVICLLVYVNRGNMPILFHINGVFSFRFLLEIFILILVVVCYYFMSHEINQDYFSADYIYQAVVLLFFTSFWFILMGKNPISFFNVLAHLTRVGAYILLLRGIFGRAVVYPYERLEEILNHLPLAIGTFDRNYRLTFGNRRAEEIAGDTCERCLGLSYHALMKRFNPTGESPLINKIKLEEGKVHNKIFTLVNNENKSVKIALNAFLLKSGGYLILFDEAQKIQALDNMQLQTQTILNSINSQVLILDNRQRILMCNNALLEDTGMDAKDLIGMHINDFGEIMMVPGLADMLNQKEPFEISYRSLDGLNKDLLMQIALIKDINDEVIGTILVGTNITDINREKHEKLQQDKLALLGQMASGIVHEIKNPLTTIQGFSNLIKANPQSFKNAEYAAIIENEVKGLNRFINDFLTFARPRAPILKKVPVNQLLNSVKMLYESHLLLNRIPIVYCLGEDNLMVDADENQVKQVILNIINNAVDVLDDVDDPEIIISTGYDRAANMAYIRIHNNGPALTDEERKNIGTPFFTTKPNGTGLGLSICRQIMKDHGGILKITSEQNYGTAFELCFPVTPRVSS